jgi:hypothetical protein
MTTEKRAGGDDDGVEWMTGSGRGSNLPVPRVTVLEHGLVLSIYPDPATLQTMREEEWTTVTVGFKKNEAGETTELLLRKGGPIRIRYDYGHQKPHIRVTIKRRGRAVAKPNAGACQVTRGGDDFVFDVTSQLTIAASV